AGAGRDDIRYIATTGFGRYNVPFRDVQITEITCAAAGAAFLFPASAYVLDIGFQSTRAIRLREGGRVHGFATNDKCAAGAGGFVERAARYLEVPLEEMGELSLRATEPQSISSICAVLAETEIINHLTAGATVENIVGGIHRSLAARAQGLIRRIGISVRTKAARAGVGERAGAGERADAAARDGAPEPEKAGGEDGQVTFVGGVARQAGMIKALRETLGRPVNVPESPDLVCALGAALLGLSRLARGAAPTAGAPAGVAAREG
ncbi:MAG: hypothetical protein HY660_11765, partial [Armatimonadetes bacterium]|nr:hypothetical protein [Armatimonadota bacterium]